MTSMMIPGLGTLDFDGEWWVSAPIPVAPLGTESPVAIEGLDDVASTSDFDAIGQVIDSFRTLSPTEFQELATSTAYSFYTSTGGSEVAASRQKEVWDHVGFLSLLIQRQAGDQASKQAGDHTEAWDLVVEYSCDWTEQDMQLIAPNGELGNLRATSE